MLVSIAGAAVGIGSLWQLAFMVGQFGGGFFLLSYVVLSIVLGIPLFAAEFLLGKRGRSNIVSLFQSAAPQYGWIGNMSLLSCIFSLSYYSVVAGWGLHFFLRSCFFSVSKATPNALMYLQSSSSMSVMGFLLFLWITAAIVQKGVHKGIERCSKFCFPLLFLFLIILFLYALASPGAKEAAYFLFWPRWTPELTHNSSVVFVTALGLALFTLSLGQGQIATYGSYAEKEVNVPRLSFLIGAINLFVALISGFSIYALLFSHHLPLSDSLFVLLPQVFAETPGGMFYSLVFFALFSFAAITSSISMMEVVVLYGEKYFRITRVRSTLIVVLIVMTVGIPCSLSDTLFVSWKNLYGISIFDTLVALVARWTLPLVSLAVSIIVGWWIPQTDLYKHFSLPGSRWNCLFKPWRFLIRYVVTPIIICLVAHSIVIP